MALHSQFRMPGTFQSDGVHPDIFRTPAKSPCSASSSGYLSTRAIPSGIEEETSTKRKRHHGSDGYSTRIRAQSQSLAQNAGARFNNPFLATTNPEPRAYTLAGHIHTPTNEYNDGNTAMADSIYSDSDYRRMLGTKRPRDDLDANNAPLFPIQPIQQQQYLDQQQQLTQSQGWGAFAFATLGDVVGRLWQFCKAGSFKGFHAGGGRGYEMNGQADEVMSMTPNEPNNFQPQAQHLFETRFSRTPAREYVDNNSDADSRSSSPAAPAAKRRQTGPSDELTKNWVMVGKSGTPSSTQRGSSTYTQPRQTPRNRNHGPSAATGRRISTPNNRRSTAGLGPLNTAVPTLAETRPISSASYASPRSPSPTKIPNPTTSASLSVPRNHAGRRPRPSAGVATTPSHRRTNSNASTASPRGSRSFNDGPGAEGSPRLTSEARKLAAQRQQEDDETDFRMEAFNKQLQDMIRQGKEALGTTIEVEGDDDFDGGGGWEDYQ